MSRRKSGDQGAFFGHLSFALVTIFKTMMTICTKQNAFVEFIDELASCLNVKEYISQEAASPERLTASCGGERALL